MPARQLTMFEAEASLPEGFRYRAEFVSPEEEAELVERMQTLPFKPFEFQGFLGNRRTVSFGYHYRFDGSGLHRAEEIPSFLLPIRERAARFAGVEAAMFEHVLLIEYGPGAGIGWHRDRPVFDKVVGISLLAPARLRFRRRDGDKWQRAALIAEPRSAYLLSGAAREEWEHSIPEMETLRYSITFRNLRETKLPQRQMRARGPDRRDP